MSHPLQVYGDGLVRARERQRFPADARLRLRDGTFVAVPLERYLGLPDAIDVELLRELVGPVLDVGCGPGRHLHELATRGVFALGVDLSPVAVELATGQGGRAIVASIFDELPGAGTWRSALLLDGNIGIGGVPSRLLARIETLLAPDGRLLVELDPPAAPTGSLLVRMETAEAFSTWFRWARVSVRDVDRLARSGGFQTERRWCRGGRWFAGLVKIRADTA